jgi:hypothetical protein
MASKIMVILLAALLPGMCLAQSWMPFDSLSGFAPIGRTLQTGPALMEKPIDWPVRISDVSVKPLLARSTVNLRDQVDLGFRATIPQVSVSAELPGWFEARYTHRPRQKWEETLTPAAALRIGDAVFSPIDKDSKPQPIDMSWWTLSHQLDVTGRTSWPIQPYLVAHLHQFEIRALGKDADGKSIEATERFDKWFPGVGAAFRLPLPKIKPEIRAAFWQGFSTIELSLRYSPIPWVSVGAEYLREEVRIGDVWQRTEGPVLTVGVTF